MSGSMTTMIEAVLPLGSVGLLLAGAAFLWVVGIAIQSRPRSPRPLSHFRLAGRQR
jgi:hypothetical protein